MTMSAKRKAVLTYLVDQLKQPSTIRGILVLATIIGWKLNPEQSDAIVTVGGVLIGLAGTLLDDNSGKGD